MKEIKAIMDNPAIDEIQILQPQKKMILSKRNRRNRLIANIEDILKVENKMDFKVYRTISWFKT